MAVEFDPQNDINYSDSFFIPAQKPEPTLAGLILNQPASTPSLVAHSISATDDLSLTDKKTQTAVSKQTPMKTMKVGVGIGVGTVIEWGGKGGTTWSGGISGTVHDSKGNQGKGSVTYDSSGHGKGTFSGTKDWK